MITKEQCRAARSFLGLKQVELAKDCGLSKTAITHFESGLFQPRADNMTNIRNALEGRGIEFVGNYGVHKKQTITTLLEGETMYPRLWDDIFETMKAHKGGEVLIGYLDEKLPFNDNREELENHIQRLKDHNITERLLVCEGDSFFVQDAKCYRWLPRNVYQSGTTFYVYSHKVALEFWNGSVILIIENPHIVEKEKERFEHLWSNALIPSV